NCSGNVAGCFYAVLAVVPYPPPTTYLHIVFLGEFFGTVGVFVVSVEIVSFPPGVFVAVFVCPAHVVALSQVMYPLPIFPFALPSIVASTTTHTTTPPCLPTLYSSSITPLISNVYPL